MERHEVPGVVVGSLSLGDLFARVGLNSVDEVDEFDGICLLAGSLALLRELTLNEENGNVVSDYQVSFSPNT